MIKIIEEPISVTCGTCGCQFTFTSEDVKVDQYLDKNGFLGILPLIKRCKAVRCPLCNEPYIIKFY